MGNANVVSKKEERERQTFSRKQVEISDDCWLDVFKFLSCTQWSESRCVCRQINRTGGRNILRLPRATIEKAILDEVFSKPQLLRDLPDVNDAVVAFGAIIPQIEIEQWFVNRGIIFESRVQFQSVSTQKALFGKYSDFTDMCILGPERQQGEVRKSWFGNLFGKQESSLESVLFYSQFHPAKKVSWASLEQFLTFLFHPLSYIKAVEMFAVNQKFLDAVKYKFADNFSIHGNTLHTENSNNNKPPYINCKTFSLLYTRDMNFDCLCGTLKWLERNVRADFIRMPFVSIYTHYQDRTAVCRLLNNFVFGALRICAKRELRLHAATETNLYNIFFSLIEKFLTLPLIEREIPTIVIEPFSLFCFIEIKQALRQNVIYREMESQGLEFLCVVENGNNRMRISFCERADRYLAYDWAKEYDCYVKFYAA